MGVRHTLTEDGRVRLRLGGQNSSRPSLSLTLPRYFFRNPKNIPAAPAPVDGRYPASMCLSPSAPRCMATMAWLICVAAAAQSRSIQPVLSAQDRVSVALYCRGGLDIVAAWCLDRCLTGCCSFRCSSSTVRLQESGFPKRACRLQLRDFSTNGHESCGLVEPASNELNDRASW